MFSRIFPRQIDNGYQGYKFGILLFVAVALLKGTQGFFSLTNAHDTLINADGIPLDSFGTAAAQTVIRLFALLGLNGLVLPLISLVVVIRYRAMIPFMFLMFTVLQLASRVSAIWYPLARTGVPIGVTVNLVILVITLIGFALSISTPRPQALRGAN